MNQIIMILLISLLVLVHEAGHFIAAKMCGIRVTRFGIGMPIGPEWKLFSWANTDFYIHAFLFGGYVSFPDDEPEPSELSSSDQSEKIPEDEYYENKTISQKLFVVSAGVLMNIVFAIFLVIMSAAIFHKLPASKQDIFIDSFSKNITSNAQQRGLLSGDKILKVNGLKIDSLYQLTFFARNSKAFDGYADETLYNYNLNELKKLNPNNNKPLILPPQSPEAPLSVNSDVLRGLQKYKEEGIKLNDKQIELRDRINENKTVDADLKDLALALSDTYKPISVTVLRNNEEITIENIKVNTEGMLGVMLRVEDIYAPTKTPAQIIKGSFNYLWSTTTTMLYSLWQLFTGKISASDMHGVIAIVKVGGDIIASKGILNGILLSAMISINLAIMNLLPIPALDGGHIMFLIIEKITGKKPQKELAQKINSFFFILLIILMISICYNDIFALVTKKF